MRIRDSSISIIDAKECDTVTSLNTNQIPRQLSWLKLLSTSTHYISFDPSLAVALESSKKCAYHVLYMHVRTHNPICRPAD